jgi:hypothetical protein
MNSKELRIYTALTHRDAPEDYRITDNGTRIYTMVDGALMYFEGEDLDDMNPRELYAWTQNEIRKFHEKQHRLFANLFLA